jgi:hypothetical protein
LADKFGLIIAVTHYPPGASKWNPIDHRMFSLISANWAGEPLDSYEKVLKYIRTTHEPLDVVPFPAAALDRAAVEQVLGQGDVVVLHLAIGPVDPVDVILPGQVLPG